MEPPPSPTAKKGGFSFAFFKKKASKDGPTDNAEIAQKKALVQEGHKSLSKVADMVNNREYQYRFEPGHLELLHQRWAELLGSAPKGKKFNKGLFAPEEFREKSRVLYEDTKGALQGLAIPVAPTSVAGSSNQPHLGIPHDEPPPPITIQSPSVHQAESSYSTHRRATSLRDDKKRDRGPDRAATARENGVPKNVTRYKLEDVNEFGESKHDKYATMPRSADPERRDRDRRREEDKYRSERPRDRDDRYKDDPRYKDDRYRSGDRDRERYRDRDDRDRDRYKERDRDKYRDKEKERERDERYRDREKEHKEPRAKDYPDDKERDRDRERRREKDKYYDRDGRYYEDKYRERDKYRDREKDYYKDRESRDKYYRDRDSRDKYYRDRERDSRDKYRERDKYDRDDRERDRSYRDRSYRDDDQRREDRYRERDKPREEPHRERDREERHRERRERDRERGQEEIQPHPEAPAGLVGHGGNYPPVMNAPTVVPYPSAEEYERHSVLHVAHPGLAGSMRGGIGGGHSNPPSRPRSIQGSINESRYPPEMTTTLPQGQQAVEDEEPPLMIPPPRRLTGQFEPRSRFQEDLSSVFGGRGDVAGLRKAKTVGKRVAVR